jgi:[1-hydroxy-2-(trimethylamino)ethyl]phosphonate dioxygenase
MSGVLGMTAGLQEIEELFARRGRESYGESVTQEQHALQTAALALAEGADDAMVVAALLHDIGHFVGPTDDAYGRHRHDKSGGDWLARRFGPEVSEPARLHVAAKRYHCATEQGYVGRLSQASLYTLGKQGGPMRPGEAAAFAANPHAAAALRLRRWDDEGKREGLAVPALADHRDRIIALLRPEPAEPNHTGRRRHARPAHAGQCNTLTAAPGARSGRSPGP